MTRYEIREICGDWAIYEVRPDAEGEYTESEPVLILNSRRNAEYVKAILEHEAKDPNVAVPYRPEVAQMSDAECVAVNRLCCTGGHQCHACPFSGSESLEETCFEVERRVNGLAEKYLEHRKNIELIRAPIETAAECGARMKGGAGRYVELKKEPDVGGEDEKKTLEAMKYDICKSADYCYGACCECIFESLAKALYARGYRKQSENVIELPCKVGTTLYFLYNSPYADKPDLTPRIYKTTDWYFEVDKTGIVINTSDIHSFNKKYDYYLGETVFLTKQEAEQALAKMKGGAG